MRNHTRETFPLENYNSIRPSSELSMALKEDESIKPSQKVSYIFFFFRINIGHEFAISITSRDSNKLLISIFTEGYNLQPFKTWSQMYSDSTFDYHLFDL